MISDSEIFDYVNHAVESNAYKYVHVTSVFNELSNIKNIVSLKVVKQNSLGKLRRNTYKNYINRAVNNTFLNCVRDFRHKLEHENSQSLYTIVKVIIYYTHKVSTD